MAKPEIRLKGFDGEWKECPFHVVAKPYFVSNKYAHHQNLLSLSYGKVKRKDINSGKGLLPASFDTYQIIKDGIIVFRFTDLQNDKKSLRVGLAKEEGIISPAYVCVECENISPEFLFLQLYSYDLRKVFYSMGDGLRQTLSYNDVKDMPIYVPSDKEQKFIIEYFNSIESEILSEESKLASLKQMKKACLVSMFPQAGETTPRVRFKGFEGEWEVVKLSSIANRVTRKNSHLESTLPLTISAADGLIEQTSFFNNVVASSNVSGYYLVKNGEFAYNKSYSSGYPFGAVKRLDRYEKGVLSTLYIVFSIDEKVSSDYIVQFFETSLWHQEVAKRAAEGARNHGLLNIGADDFLDIDINLPKRKDEQQQIASFFTCLDKQISLQEQRLEKLKQIKAACLDKMFV